jgi:hypothetical protein
MKARRVAAAVCAALVAFALVCSLAFICTEAHHDCAGEDCPVCALLAFCQNAIGRLLRAAAALYLTGALIEVFSLCVMPDTARCGVSPVSFGVRLLN